MSFAIKDNIIPIENASDEEILEYINSIKTKKKSEPIYKGGSFNTVVGEWEYDLFNKNK